MGVIHQKGMIMKVIITFTVLFVSIISFSLYAQEVSFTQEDRDRLVRLEVMLEATDKRITDMLEATNKRITDLREDMNKRFEQVDKKFEQVDKRFEQVDKRFEQMFNFLWILTGIFTTLTIGIIGFAYWDRRTIIRKAKEETIEELERKGKLRDLINALRELAKTDPNVETVLKNFHLL